MDVIQQNVFLQTPAIDSKNLEDRKKRGIQSPFKVWGPLEQDMSTTETDIKIKEHISKIKLVSYFNIFQSLQTTLLIALLFESQNVTRLHDDIVSSILNKTGVNIGPQSVRELVLLMYDTYMLQAKQLNESQYPFDDLLKMVKQEVMRLNQITKKKAMSLILTGMKEQAVYKKQKEASRVSDLPMPLSTSKTGTLQYRDKMF